MLKHNTCAQLRSSCLGAVAQDVKDALVLVDAHEQGPRQRSSAPHFKQSLLLLEEALEATNEPAAGIYFTCVTSTKSKNTDAFQRAFEMRQ